jgi:hypothetical protein
MVLLIGCSGPDIASPFDEWADAPAMAVAAVPDVSEAWNWTRVEHLTMPAWVAQFVAGIVPEGPVTQAYCESAGTMNLSQSGATFSGPAAQTWISCVTKGGHEFQPPGWDLEIAVVDGRMKGSSIQFSFNSATPAPCPHHGVISAVTGGKATALSASGRCFVPGHPKSESPIVLLPPPAGTSKTLAWEAVRP